LFTPLLFDRYFTFWMVISAVSIHLFVDIYLCWLLQIGKERLTLLSIGILTVYLVFSYVSGRYNHSLWILKDFETLITLETCYQSIFHLETWPIGESLHKYHFPSHFPLGSPRIPPLFWIYPSLKSGEGLSEVKVGKLSHYYLHLVDWVWIFPTYNLCDKILASLSGRILNPLACPIDTLSIFLQKSFTPRFLDDSTWRKFPFHPWWDFLEALLVTPPSKKPPFLGSPFSILWWALISYSDSIDMPFQSMELLHHGMNPHPDLFVPRGGNFYRWKRKKMLMKLLRNNESCKRVISKKCQRTSPWGWINVWRIDIWRKIPRRYRWIFSYWRSKWDIW